MIEAVLKFFRANSGQAAENGGLPKTMRFRGLRAHQGTFTNKHDTKNAILAMNG